MPIKINVPGFQMLEISNVVFDLNGTLANKGLIKDSTVKLILELTEKVDVYIITADTHNKASTLKKLFNDKVNLTILSGSNTAIDKEDKVKKLGAEKTIAIGNGANDVKMMNLSTLSVAIIGQEGCSVKALNASDIVVNNIDDIIEMLLHTDRIVATLRG